MTIFNSYFDITRGYGLWSSPGESWSTIQLSGGTTARLIDAMSDRCACSRQNKGRRSSNAAKPISLASVPSHHWIGVLGKRKSAFSGDSRWVLLFTHHPESNSWNQQEIFRPQHVMFNIFSTPSKLGWWYPQIKWQIDAAWCCYFCLLIGFIMICPSIHQVKQWKVDFYAARRNQDRPRSAVRVGGRTAGPLLPSSWS